jgi:hypothetical protein
MQGTRNCGIIVENSLELKEYLYYDVEEAKGGGMMNGLSTYCAICGNDFDSEVRDETACLCPECVDRWERDTEVTW